MSRCVRRRCSRSCHGEYGRPWGLRPRTSTGVAATARSKSTCASCHARAFASWSRRTFNTELTEFTEIFLVFSVGFVVSVLIVLVSFEELDGPFVLFRGRARREGAEVLPLPCFRIFFPRIEP